MALLVKTSVEPRKGDNYGEGLHHGVVRSKLAEASELDDDVTRWLG